MGLIGKAFERGGKIDATLANYLKSIIAIVLNIVLILAILDIFGVRTTSFAALLAGAGLAIGAAWSGMRGNFAAGVFMQVLHPYKVAAALRQLRVDLGGYLVDFPANGKNVGAEFVDIGVVDSRGKLMY